MQGMYLLSIKIGQIEIHIDKNIFNMKVCIVGNYSNALDEGMANVTYNIYTILKSKYTRNDIHLLNVKNIKSTEFWKTILTMNPDIVHYIPGPTFKGLLLVKLIGVLTSSRTVSTATQPSLPHNIFFSKIIFPMLKPDIVLVQSESSEEFFKSIDYKTRFLANGVDTERFVPIDTNKRNEIRKKYGFNEEDFIVLHVGPIKRGRNQMSLVQLKDIKLLLIVSLTNPSEEDAYREVANTHAIVWKRYFPNVEEVYAMSDVYVWPASEKFHGIEMPLSVLEAMSCNLPVITTKYGALDRVFQEKNDGLIFVTKEDQIPEAVTVIKNRCIKINTREKVRLLSWKNIADEVGHIYEELCREK
jgi:glycosyltransferase involved in cell wall biosynthesis